MIIGVSLTHNDKSKGWLKEWYTTNSKYVDKWIILDDCSDDGTYRYMKENMDKINCKVELMKTGKSIFKDDEIGLRSMLWEEVRRFATEGDRVLLMDSDEILTDDFKHINKFMEVNKLLVFKKLEMWDNENYRIDGLWSNYFERMFPFKDLPFGYTDKQGFHFPPYSEYVKEYEILNTNFRIKHLGYKTKELRDAKLKFMFENSQQRKMDLNYLHLSTIDCKPILKKFDNKKKNILTFVICDKVYKLKPGLLKHIRDNESIVFISDSHLNVYNQLKDKKGIQNFIFNDISSEERKMYMLNDILKNKNKFIEDYDGILIIEGTDFFYNDTVDKLVQSDKDVVTVDYTMNTMYLSSDVLKNTENKYQSKGHLIKHLGAQYLVWSTINSFPNIIGPLFNKNVKLLGVKTKDEICNSK